MTKETEVKKFVAPTMSRALELVRDEMGPEAIILSSQKVSGGVEIVTSIERDLPTRGVSERRSFGQNFDAELDRALESDTSWSSQAGIEQAASSYASQVEINQPASPRPEADQDDLAMEIERARERMLAAKREASESSSGAEPKDFYKRTKTEHRSGTGNSEEGRQQRVTQPSSGDAENEMKLEALRGEIADLRMVLEQQMWQQGASNRDAAPIEPSHSGAKRVLQEHLSRLGLSDDVISGVASGAARVSEGWKQSLALLSKRIRVAEHIDTSKGGIYAFIGPTGVGKTTSLSKLAAQYSMEHGPGNVAIVSMDTHRVGAVEQLNALGRILDAPVSIVTPNKSLMMALTEVKDFPLVLIDTAGFRQGDPQLLTQLDQLNTCPQVKRMLVLSSLSQLQTLKASIHAYRPRDQKDACIISKVDEATSLGEALSVLIQHELPVAYVSDGQRIPTDIHAASAHNLVANAVSLMKQRAVEVGAS